MLFGRRRAREDERRARALHGKTIRYVTERSGTDDLVLGRAGVVSVHGGELIVLASSHTVFRTPLDTISVSYLLSGDGAVLRGRDMEHGDAEREITVHFVDYIK